MPQPFRWLDVPALKNIPFLAWVALLLILSCGCTSALYRDMNPSASDWNAAVDPTRQPIILVPGFQGSMLLDPESGTQVWGAFTNTYAHPDTPEGMRLMALPMEPGIPLNVLRDQVIADDLLRQFRFNVLRLLPMHVDGYGSLLRTLEADGYHFHPTQGPPDTTQYYNAFIFTYDWRRDNVENARRLYHFVEEKQAYLQQQNARRGIAKAEPVRFNLITHSMGGLLTRYMLRYGDSDLPATGPLPPVTWAGTRHIDTVILTAPPNAGSLRAFRGLLEGRKYLPGVGRFEPAVLGTLPALYQMLPREGGGQVIITDDTRHTVGDLYDVAVWEQQGWGLADPAQAPVLRLLLPEATSDTERRRIALDHLRKNLRQARRFAEALEVAATPPAGITIHLIAGDDQPTDAVAVWDAHNRRLRIIAQRRGDSRVLRSSSRLPDALTASFPSSQTIYLNSRHMALTRDLLYGPSLRYLLRQYRPRDG